jgi:hypothetical protein
VPAGVLDSAPYPVRPPPVQHERCPAMGHEQDLLTLGRRW